jgi:hypothetical protein
VTSNIINDIAVWCPVCSREGVQSRNKVESREQKTLANVLTSDRDSASLKFQGGNDMNKGKQNKVVGNDALVVSLRPNLVSVDSTLIAKSLVASSIVRVNNNFADILTTDTDSARLVTVREARV